MNMQADRGNFRPEASEQRALLTVKGLQVAFSTPQGRVDAVRDVSLQIASGEILALVGESGSGKSVTARAIVGLAGPRAAVKADAMELIAHDGRLLNLHELPEKAWRHVRGREIGFILQDALVSLDPLRTIGREIAEPILTHRLAPRLLVSRHVAQLLERVGVPEPELRVGQYAHQLSGGLRQRALIASALAAQPRLLVADEPTTALDVSVQKRVLAIFKELAAAGHGILLITHDLSVAAQLADRVAVMQRGQLVETGPARSILSNPRHDYTRQLLAAVPTAANRGQRLSAPGTSLPPRAAVSSDQRLLDIRNVSMSFRKTDGSLLRAVTDVSLHIDSGETVGVVGESGSGKTTLGKIALALQHPDAGEVLFEGRPWSALSERARRPLRAGIQTISQDPLSSFDPRFTVERIIGQPLRLYSNLSRSGRREETVRLMGLVGLPENLLLRRPAALSGGQRQRVVIAQALAATPKLLICDEPVSALDVTTQAQVLDLLVDLQARLGLSIIFISHDLGVIQHISQRIVVMKDGAVVEAGSVEEVFERPRHDYTRELIASMPKFGDG
ncbi:MULTISPECIES: ABC transporter ATP-binding protein [unclassified Rhizobium]|uniref:dipeptide ABC transporter ATP-binding protein n=1 Tax=unclassified Rhizobium TaxID=2613769 RepID=UPI000EA9BFDB|nr:MULTISPECIES: ABC transporter ATP-binding protein [unclassified Rhizobium]AYG69370.1 ABC transporter ATP-binding protein [Rhizobium sp. CCGE531]AYG75751.1 ABC transporter ATP-binding protein [Rhizobium sp. CCGE532]